MTGGEHPVAYASRKLLPRETRYAAVEKECLAVVDGICSFRAYPEGRHFEVQTDHRSLQYLHRLRDSNGRLSHWSLCLQPFDFSVQAAGMEMLTVCLENFVRTMSPRLLNP